VKGILEAGWVGQVKIHGHRAQIHIPHDPSQTIVVFNRQGHEHRKALPPVLVTELFRVFRPKAGWNILDAEWMKATDELYIFDFLKRDGVLLDRLSYLERFEMLPRVYGSAKIVTLPPLKKLHECLAVLEDPRPHVEGLVFKSPTTRGFLDSAIVRCRRKELKV
jgi:ATP-dependent DNA ligase